MSAPICLLEKKTRLYENDWFLEATDNSVVIQKIVHFFISAYIPLIIIFNKNLTNLRKNSYKNMAIQTWISTYIIFILIFEIIISSNYFLVDEKFRSWFSLEFSMRFLNPSRRSGVIPRRCHFPTFFNFSPGFYLIFENIRDFLYHRRGGGLCFVIAYAALWLDDRWVINYAMSQQTVVTSKTLCLKIYDSEYRDLLTMDLNQLHMNFTGNTGK